MGLTFFLSRISETQVPPTVMLSFTWKQPVASTSPTTSNRSFGPVVPMPTLPVVVIRRRSEAPPEPSPVCIAKSLVVGEFEWASRTDGFKIPRFGHYNLTKSADRKYESIQSFESAIELLASADRCLVRSNYSSELPDSKSWRRAEFTASHCHRFARRTRCSLAQISLFSE